MPLLIEVLHQHIPAAVIVIQDRTCTGELVVAAMHEHHGNAAIEQLLIEIQVWIGEPCFGAFDEQTIQLGEIEEGVQDAALIGNLVFGGKKQRGAVAFGENIFRFTQEAGEDVVADIGCEHSDAPGGGGDSGGFPVENMGSAALTLFNEAVLHQKGKRLPHGLTADLVLLCKGLLRGEKVDGGILAGQDLLPKLLGKLLILGHHGRTNPFSRENLVCLQSYYRTTCIA